MPNFTPNLNLEKPLQGEFYNVDVFNSNSDKIDTTVGNILTNSYQKPVGGIPLADVSSQITDRLDWYGTTTGTTNVTLNIPEFVGTLKPGTVLRFKYTGLSSAIINLNFNGTGNKSVRRANGSTTVNFVINGIYTVVYDGANFILQGEGSGGNALAAEILSGRTATTDNGEVSGTMPNRGTFNLGLGVTVPAGYYSGGTTANGKRNLTGITTLSNSNSLPFISLSGLSFRPSVIILTVSYQSTDYTKIYRDFNYLDNITFTNNTSAPTQGNYPWVVNNNGFNTTFSNNQSLIGRTCSYLIYE